MKLFTLVLFMSAVSIPALANIQAGNLTPAPAKKCEFDKGNKQGRVATTTYVAQGRSDKTFKASN